ncbi:hypothetical protein BGZ76_002027 [Entomortierella beljakovae]|nr:hypothetical protein BGZ76_002027 [Entomortierella beljakovae]
MHFFYLKNSTSYQLEFLSVVKSSVSQMRMRIEYLRNTGHREPTGTVKNIPRIFSMPSTTGDDCYNGIHPVTMPNENGYNRLVIGTFKCDVLITSCTRLDISIGEETISLGAITDIFKTSSQNSKNIKVYLDEGRVSEVQKMKEMTTSKVTENMGTDRLRQIRTKFNELNSYELCRFSGPLTNTSLYQPITVFTYSNHTNVQSSGFAAAGSIFYSIGKSVIINGDNAVIFRKDVGIALQNCKGKGQVYDVICDILEVFDENEEIKIIGNMKLNTELERMADLLSSKITNSNKTVALELRKLFRASKYD